MPEPFVDSGFFRLWTAFLKDLANWCPLFSGIPRLLVSVRNATEALSAMRGGADIVDIKEPANGSLGRASLDDMVAIARSLRDAKADSSRAVDKQVPLSIALGEVPEWSSSSPFFGNGSHTSVAAAIETSDSLCEAISELQPAYMKLGLANAYSMPITAGNWRDSWIDARCRFGGDHNWVAVVYADHERANSPDPDEILAAAFETNCSVLLIDTYVKDGTSLLDWLGGEQLEALRKKTSAQGLQLALAGRVTIADLPILLPVEPDIIAVRGAVCESGVRTSSVCEKLVAEFQARLESG